jgi:superfamily II DNA helicase RecQ
VNASDAPLLLLSGSPETQVDLVESFGLTDPVVISHVCTRPNIFLEVRQGGSFSSTLGPLLVTLKENPCVIYANSAKKAKKIAEYLHENGKRSHIQK